MDGLRYFLDQVENLPQLESLYLGIDRDASFYQALRLGNVKIIGPAGRAPPAEARYIVRLLDDTSSHHSDSYIYLVKWGDIVRVERGPGKFDPRPRPWYTGAFASTGTVISDVYPFASTGTVGMTISRRVESDDGVVIGAVGANISLARVSAFLDQRKIGGQGRIFIIDGEDRLIAHPTPSMGIKIKDGNAELVKASESADPIVASAVKQREQGAGDFFSAPLDANGNVYRVSFAAFPDRFGKKWTIGVIVLEDEFIGPLRRLSLRFVGVGSVIIFISILAILWLSHRLTRPLSVIVTEAERIREFDLDGEMHLSSRITEVNELAGAVAAMKHSLRSFGAYVPKALVRNILAAQGSAKIGGERQFLTVMFTDIRNFTHSTESLPPEDLANDLSVYFREMSGAIHSNKGVIDKFIGDAIMAIWNAPVADPNHVTNACRAMLACRTISNRIDQTNKASGKMPIFTRLGLHCGQMMAGNVGSDDRMQFTVLGGAVNLAARLEGMNKYYGTQLLVSDAVRDEAGSRFLFRWVDRVTPSGVSIPIDLFELCGELDPQSADPASPADHERVQAWTPCVERYLARDWAGLAAQLALFQARYPEDGPAKVLQARCAEYLITPPPADWDLTQHYDKK
jgi:adenylate cyclase